MKEDFQGHNPEECRLILPLDGFNFDRMSAKYSINYENSSRRSYQYLLEVAKIEEQLKIERRRVEKR
jgi:hypothetical protein